MYVIRAHDGSYDNRQKSGKGERDYIVVPSC
jgi:hypothetical protein